MKYLKNLPSGYDCLFGTLSLVEVNFSWLRADAKNHRGNYEPDQAVENEEIPFYLKVLVVLDVWYSSSLE